MLKQLKNFKWGYILLTLLIAASGVCFIAFRETLSTIALIMGIILSIFAVVFAVITIADKKRGVSFALKIAFSVIALSCGILTIAVHKSDAVEWLVAIFGLLLIIDGSFKLHTSAMSKRYRSVGWWLVLIPAVLVIVGGFFTIRYQLTGTTEEELLEQQSLISVIMGVTMIIDALANLLSAFFISSYEKKMKNQFIEEYARSTDEQVGENTSANADGEPTSESAITADAITKEAGSVSKDAKPDESASADDSRGAADGKKAKKAARKSKKTKLKKRL